MTPRKGKAPARGTKSQPRFHSSPKRPAAAGETTPSRPAAKRQRISVPNLLSSPHSDDLDETISSKPRRGGVKKGADKMQADVRDAFANMYDFGPAKLKKEEVNGGISQPQNGKPKAPLPAQRVPFNPATGPKKLVVKNLRAASRLDTKAYFEKTWAEEDKALDAIFRNEKDPYSLEALYKGAENTCRTRSQCRSLYESELQVRSSSWRQYQRCNQAR